MSVTTLTPTTIDAHLIWKKCIDQMQRETIIPVEKFNTWLRPLQAASAPQNPHLLLLYAPNQFVIDSINESYQDYITQMLHTICSGLAIATPSIKYVVGSATMAAATISPSDGSVLSFQNEKKQTAGPSASNVNRKLSFATFVAGKSNQLARAAAEQIAENPGQAYNPLFIYGGVGLGKTHLAHAIGNHIQMHSPDSKVLYLHSERFVADMIKGLQRNKMDEFKSFYRTVSCLLIDDIQFFANKERSQEEFFYTFNHLLDGEKQIVLTCDRYPKEITGLEERLQSRFGWGLTVAIEPPELETRVAILLSKAEQSNIDLPNDVAFFIAKHIQSNVRELEGALKRVTANSQLTGHPLTVPFAREALRDLLALQAKLVTLDNIQKTVADYYKVKVSDLLCKRRSRSVTLPRQIAMTIAKDLTSHSYPEIGEAFGGRDHTTVLHACRKIKEVLKTNLGLQEDFKVLLRILSA